MVGIPIDNFKLKIKTGFEVLFFIGLFLFILLFVPAGFGWLGDDVSFVVIGYLVSFMIIVAITYFIFPIVFKEYDEYFWSKNKVVEELENVTGKVNQ